jgi:hypothetical protein
MQVAGDTARLHHVASSATENLTYCSVADGTVIKVFETMLNYCEQSLVSLNVPLI